MTEAHNEMTEQFVLMQAGVATRLGVCEERVRELRRRWLEEGVDWVKRGSRIWYAPGAVQKLAEGMQVPEVPESAKAPALIGFPEVHRIQVLKVWSNPSYVGGILALAGSTVDPQINGGAITNALGDGWEAIPANADELTLLRVRVKHNGNLARGMVLPCVHIASDLYEAVQLPRRKGRW